VLFTDEDPPIRRDRENGRIEATADLGGLKTRVTRAGSEARAASSAGAPISRTKRASE